MTRLPQRLVTLYLLVALWGHYKEGRGELCCHCRSDCWCKKPGLSLFRWVFPLGHSVP